MSPISLLPKIPISLLIFGTVISITIVIALSPHPTASQEMIQMPLSWQIQIVDSGNVTGPTYLMLDSNGYPKIAYIERTTPAYNLKYASWNGQFWEFTTVDDCTCIGTGSVSLALDNADEPHISYHNYTNNTLKYAQLVNGNWVIETVDSSSAGSGNFIILDANNNPHIVYFAQEGDLKYAHYQESAWSYQLIESHAMPTPISHEISLAINSLGLLGVSYPSQEYKLKYAHQLDNGEWVIQVVNDVDGLLTSLVFDNQDYPHIVIDENEIRYVKWTGNSWDIQIVDSGFLGSLALDNAGYPAISYYRIGLRFAYWVGNEWDIHTVDGSQAVGYDSSLFIDSENHPHISYIDSNNRDLKYAVGVLPPSPTATSTPLLTQTATPTATTTSFPTITTTPSPTAIPESSPSFYFLPIIQN